MSSASADTGRQYSSTYGMPSNSARVTEAEKAIRSLEEENTTLRKELTDLRALYHQLISEGKHESFDERRVLLLKSQVIQLERQIVILSNQMSSRSETLVYVENSLAACLHVCKSLLQQKEGYREVKVARDEFNRIVENIESARARLFHNVHTADAETARPLLTFNEFLKSGSDKPPTVFDVCSGETNHLNLKQVSRLETKLVQLYQQLKLLNSALVVSCVKRPVSDDGLVDAPAAVYSRLYGHVTRSCDLLEDVCSSLLKLSLLIPAAPHPALNRALYSREITAENILNAFRAAGIKSREVRRLVDSMVKAMNYTVDISGAEKDLLLNELDFHRAVYEHQSNYVSALFRSVVASSAEFISNLHETLLNPLSSVVASFDRLKNNSTEDALLTFIAEFKLKAPAFSETMLRFASAALLQQERDILSDQCQNNLLAVLEKCRSDCRRKRDELISHIDCVKEQLHEHVSELSQQLSKIPDPESPQSVDEHGMSASKVPSAVQKHAPSLNKQDDSSEYHRQTSSSVAVASNYGANRMSQPVANPMKSKRPSRTPDNSVIVKSASMVNLASKNLADISIADDDNVSRERSTQRLNSRAALPGIAQKTLSLKPKTARTQAKTVSYEAPSGHTDSSDR